MRKHRVSLLATFYADSKTLAWHVEQERDGSVWELVDEGLCGSSKLCSDLFAALLGALSEMTADESPSITRTSEVTT